MREREGDGKKASKGCWRPIEATKGPLHLLEGRSSDDKEEWRRKEMKRERGEKRGERASRAHWMPVEATGGLEGAD